MIKELVEENRSAESGFIVLLGMLLLVLGSATWFATLGNTHSNTLSLQKNREAITQLHQIKERMLAYAVLHPELYADATNVPGVGYFPCPDEDGDGDADTNCGRDSAGTDELFVLGMVPYKISSRFFSFLNSDVDNRDYWYAVDSRFVNSSAQYATAISQRYSSLTMQTPRLVANSSGAMVNPMTLDGQSNIIMILFYAGPMLAGQSRPSVAVSDYLEQGTVVAGSTFDFTTAGSGSADFNDYVIKITRREWEAAMLSRVSQDNAPEDAVPDLCVTTLPADIHWFNACKYTGASIPPFTVSPLPSTCVLTTVIAEQNITGQGWRDIICP
ncbi:MAG: hypothetical protein GXO35_06795 [Gammaproteobacteria bacterium]|nr:hypothetical protein [Gammaproteobacteria bacterium]